MKKTVDTTVEQLVYGSKDSYGYGDEMTRDYEHEITWLYIQGIQKQRSCLHGIRENKVCRGYMKWSRCTRKLCEKQRDSYI